MAEEKKKGSFKIVILLLFIFIILPLGIISAVYFLNQDFQTQTNDVLSKMPGKLGEYFESLPTPKENLLQIKEISEYMLNIETKRAIDKLLLLKKEDSSVYTSVVKAMLRVNPNRTELILEGIRDNTVKKDVLANTIDQINKESEEELQKKVEYLNSITVSSALDEMRQIISSSINGSKDLAEILNAMEPNKAATLLKFMNKDEVDKVMQYIPFENQANIKKEIALEMSRRDDLKNIADIYSTEDVDKLLDSIGNTKNYSIDELAILYTELGPVKAGMVLSKVNDEKFVFSLINSIKENQVLENGKDIITKDILKSLKIYKDFDDNIKELSNVYSDMSSEKVAALIKNMIRNSAKPTVYTLDNGENIVITDEDIALSILKSFTKKKISEILSLLDDNLSSDLSRKLTLP